MNNIIDKMILEHPLKYCLQCSKYNVSTKENKRCPNCYSSYIMTLFVDKPHINNDGWTEDDNYSPSDEKKAPYRRIRTKKCIFRKMVSRSD